MVYSPCSLEVPEQGVVKLGGPEKTSTYRGSEVRIGEPEQKLGSRARAGSAEAGGSKMRQWRCALSFYSTCTVP